MKKTYKEPSIQLCMTRNIILCVLIPLFFALAVLCGLLNYNLSAGTVEAYQMMFNQNIQAIDSAILQSNYASSTMITYTGNIRLLQKYYQAQNEYEKFTPYVNKQKIKRAKQLAKGKWFIKYQIC